MAVVYKHIREDLNEVFYIGIGKKEKRAYFKHRKNKYWVSIVGKTGYRVEILHKDVDWQEACRIEKTLIQKYGRKDTNTGVLCNMTDGGEYSNGKIPWNKGMKYSEELKQKLQPMWDVKRTGADHPRSKAVLDLETGFKYPSVSACKKALNKAGDTISRYIKLGRLIYMN
jgi:predicted GIY-YIG superfamily endonuclease